FGRQDPTLASVRPRLLLFFLQNRLACADDLLFICEGTLRMLLAEHVKIRLVDCLAGIAESEAGRQRAADPDKPAVTVFEIDPVGDCLEEAMGRVFSRAWTEPSEIAVVIPRHLRAVITL